MENYPKTVHRLKKSNLRLTVLVNENTLRFNDHQSGGTTVNKGPTCTDGRGGAKCASTVPPPQDFHFNHWQRVNAVTWCNWLSRFLTAHQHHLVYLAPLFGKIMQMQWYQDEKQN